MAETRFPIGGLAKTGISTILVGFAGLVIWASSVEINGAVIASGFVEVEARRQLVQHPVGGQIAEIVAKSGDTVAAGDPIIRLNDFELRSQEVLYSRELHSVQARIDRLASELVEDSEPRFRFGLLEIASSDSSVRDMLAVEQALFETRRAGLEQINAQFSERVSQTEASVEGRERQLSALRRREALLNGDLKIQEELHGQGLVGAARITSILLELAELDGEIGALEASISEARSAIAAYEIERLSSLNDWRESVQEEFRSLQPREGEFTERLQFTRAEIEKLTLRAPMAGIVDDLQFFTVGGVVPPGGIVAAVVPSRDGLFLHVRIDPGQIDRVYVGQSAIVRFPNFNSRTTPEFWGTLKRVSADVLVDPQTQVRYYDAEVGLAEALPNQLILLPGMPAEVFLQSDPRTPLSFLTKPLTDYFQHALREE